MKLDMRTLLSVMLLGMAWVIVPGQKTDTAVATYSKNGRIIAVTNLSGLSDCPARSAVGKVSSVKVEGDVARVTLREAKVDADVEIPLNRLLTDERSAFFKHFVSKKVKLRVAGYACTPDAAITAFSVDRIY
jgi:hypothetical protein